MWLNYSPLKESDNVELSPWSEFPLPEDLHSMNPFQLTEVGEASSSELLLTLTPQELRNEASPLLLHRVFEPLDAGCDGSMGTCPLNVTNSGWIFLELFDQDYPAASQSRMDPIDMEVIIITSSSDVESEVILIGSSSKSEDDKGQAGENIE